MHRLNVTMEDQAAVPVETREDQNGAVNDHDQSAVADTKEPQDTAEDRDQLPAEDEEEGEDEDKEDFNDASEYYIDPTASRNKYEQATTSIPLVPKYPIDFQPNFDYRLPIPSPLVYHDQYHTPLFPIVLPPSNCWVDPIRQPYKFPLPFGPLTANGYDLHGLRLHDFGYVNFNRDKLFLKYQLWYLELSDNLFRKICPADLNDMPCEWDELQGGCQMLRLCETKHKYPHPHLGLIPDCTIRHLMQCRYIHSVAPSCRSIARQLRLSKGKRFQAQLCEVVADAGICPFGHDFESVRVEAVGRYWVHWEEARKKGSRGVVRRDVWGRKLLCPVRPLEG